MQINSKQPIVTVELREKEDSSVRSISGLVSVFLGGILSVAAFSAAGAQAKGDEASHGQMSQLIVEQIIQNTLQQQHLDTFRRIVRSGCKVWWENDRVDANKICDCLRCDFLPECYIASTVIRECLR
jgi:hypothetical protein